MFTILLLFLYLISVLANVTVRQRREDSEKYGVPDLRTTVRPIQPSPTWVASPTQESVPTWVEETDEASDEELQEEYEEPKPVVYIVQNPPLQLPLSYPLPQFLSPVSFHGPTVQYVPSFPYCCQSVLPLFPYY